MIYFSASTMGFYDTQIHPCDSIPKDAKEITRDERDRIVSGQVDAMLSSDENGYPTLVNHK